MKFCHRPFLLSHNHPHTLLYLQRLFNHSNLSTLFFIPLQFQRDRNLKCLTTRDLRKRRNKQQVIVSFSLFHQQHLYNLFFFRKKNKLKIPKFDFADQDEVSSKRHCPSESKVSPQPNEVVKVLKEELYKELEKRQVIKIFIYLNLKILFQQIYYLRLF